MGQVSSTGGPASAAEWEMKQHISVYYIIKPRNGGSNLENMLLFYILIRMVYKDVTTGQCKATQPFRRTIPVKTLKNLTPPPVIVYISIHLNLFLLLICESGTRTIFNAADSCNVFNVAIN